jgi:hypothetical protein
LIRKKELYVNSNLLNTLKEIVTQYGEAVLSEPRRVNAFFADLARDEPKPQKNAFIKCLEQGFPQALKNVPENERPGAKGRLAQKLHDEEGFDLGLCVETLDLLAALLFGETAAGTTAKPPAPPPEGKKSSHDDFQSSDSAKSQTDSAAIFAWWW